MSLRWYVVEMSLFAECAERLGHLHADSCMELAFSSHRRLSSYHRSRFSLSSHVVHYDTSSDFPSVITRFLNHSLCITFYLTLWTDWQDKDHSIVSPIHWEHMGITNLQVVMLERVSVWTMSMKKPGSMSS